MHKYKYYKFSMLDDPTVTNITIETTPLHGDSDLYASRTELFPGKDKNDKKSQRIGSLPDHITFSKTENVSLSGTYYVAVYAYTYASFNIHVSVKRNHTSKEERTK
jgi:hypothetical protein